LPTAAPPRPGVLLAPAHLVGPGDTDIPFELAAEYGWFRPFDAPADVILLSPQENLALIRRHRGWALTGLGGWSAEFCDRAPAEVALAALTAASGTEAGHTASPPLVAHAAAARLLASGWASTNRDGYHLMSAPDRLAALSLPYRAPDPHVALTGAAGTGTWTMRFSRDTPDHLLTAAATALVQTVVRRPGQVPEQLRHLVRTTGASPAAGHPSKRSAAARTRGYNAHPALRHLLPPISPPVPRLPLPADTDRAHRNGR
jgi:hypothetical protein